MDRPVVEKLRVAVTGGAGRIGTSVVKALLARGHEVIALDRRQPRERLCKFHFVDLRIREYVQPVLEGCNAVVHLGEIPHLNSGASPEETYADNTRIGANVMQTTADLGIKRLIYTSTCQVYGAWGWPICAPASLPIDESLPLRPQNAYAASKVANEGYSRVLADTTDMSVTVIRMPWVVQEDHERMRRWVARDPNAPVEGLGTYVHVSDVARAYVLAVEKGEPGWQPYHLSAAKVRLNIGLHEFLERHFPTWPKLPSDWPEQKSPLLLTRAQTGLGWEPTWDFRDAMAESAAAK
jgi:nucleoside-diphosphate-sugar epimerase